MKYSMKNEIITYLKNYKSILDFPFMCTDVLECRYMYTYVQKRTYIHWNWSYRKL